MEEENEPVNDKPLCLHLPLITKWFVMTKAGIKREDYREITPYWAKRFGSPITLAMEAYVQPDFCDTDGYGYVLKNTNYDYNIMTLGYPSNTEVAKIKKFQHKGIEIRTGKPEWGAEPDKLYFVIKHGERIL